jgi:hypothetical protein
MKTLNNIPKRIANAIPRKTGQTSEAIGRGILAGFIGTAVMTLGQLIEMKITNRKMSNTPVKAAECTIGFKANKTEADKLNNWIHFSYGTSWGEAQPVISQLRLPVAATIALHFAAVWTTALIMLPSLKLAPPIKQWGVKQIIIDALHHLVYATSTGFVYDRITKEASC